jgi:glutathione S-transferase
MVFAHEAGIVDRLEIVRSPVAMTAPNRELIAINPLSRIPTLETDDGTVLTESHAIIDYLDAMHGGPAFIPATGRARVETLRWHAIGTGIIEILVLWRNERVRPEGQVSTDLLTAFETKLGATLDWFERDLPALRAAESAILPGAPATRGLATLGHVTLACFLGYIDYRFASIDWRASHPGLATWFEPVAQRPSMIATKPID